MMDYGIEQRARDRFARTECESMGRLTDQLERELAERSPPSDDPGGALRWFVAVLLVGLVALTCLPPGSPEAQRAVPTQPAD